MADPVSLVFVDEDDLVRLRDRLCTAGVSYIRAAIGEHVAATHSSSLLCLHVPSHTTSHIATVSVVRRQRARKSVMLMNRVHQDVRSSHLGILPQRTIGRAALVTLKAERFKAPLLRRTISMGDCQICSPSRGLVTFCYRRVFAGCSRWGDGPLTDPTADHPAVARLPQDAHCGHPPLPGRLYPSASSARQPGSGRGVTVRGRGRLPTCIPLRDVH